MAYAFGGSNPSPCTKCRSSSAVEHLHGKEGVTSSILVFGSRKLDMDKRLYRSSTERKIAGVCGGLAEYFDIDPVIMRLIFVFLLLLGVGPIILVYIIFWIVVPENPSK